MKKRILTGAAALLLAIGSCFGTAGCAGGKSPISGGSKNYVAENDPRFSGEIEINGEKIQFPVMLSELKAAGWSPEEPGAISGTYDKGDLRIGLRMCEVVGEDHRVNGAYFLARDNEGAQYEFTAPKGVKLNSTTRAEVEASYGEPNETTSRGIIFYYQFPDKIDSELECVEQRNAIGFGFNDDDVVDRVWLMK